MFVGENIRRTHIFRSSSCIDVNNKDGRSCSERTHDIQAHARHISPDDVFFDQYCSSLQEGGHNALASEAASPHLGCVPSTTWQDTGFHHPERSERLYVHVYTSAGSSFNFVWVQVARNPRNFAKTSAVTAVLVAPLVRWRSQCENLMTGAGLLSLDQYCDAQLVDESLNNVELREEVTFPKEEAT